MSSLADTVREKIMYVLKEEEEKTDLLNLSVLSRVGMKVSSSTSFELDADATSASSTALIDLGLRLSESTNHGSLKEIILHNADGYGILMAINDEYIVFSGLTKIHNIGYYLGYLRELAIRIRRMISGDADTEMALSLEEEELQKLRDQKEDIDEEEAIVKPSLEQDKEALDGLLGFLDDWEKEGDDFTDLEAENEGNIVSIPKTMTTDVKAAETTVSIPTSPDQSSATTPSPATETSSFKVYDDEVPPVPLEDYTPMEMEEETSAPETQPESEPEPEPKAPAQEELPPLDDLPSFDDLNPPDFDSQVASEYNTEFILEEESESLDSVLKELGWEEE
ncbi:MAG: hypothetical protein GF317_10930 [Candidatus Lokiarchaeota archaeon]|nr:hypothetical protein [Candidatus Lokiarchaeota archaeon]MBD3200176.1 hypothetical protein [Candidatus Lokiarchaeota archaeon]